jgi:asparagine synthase (glutamine-hydrolysing)
MTSPYAPYADSVAAFADVRDSVVAMMAVELQTWLVDAYLEKVDKATMAVSLEARVPLLDPRLVEMMALAPRSWKLRRGETKVLFKEIAARYIPAANVRKPKQGFGPPYSVWLQTVFRERVACLADASSPLSGLVDRGAVRRIVEGLKRGEPRAAQVWNLLVLEEWAQSNSTRATAATVPSIG